MLKKLSHSFFNATRGIMVASSERNMRIHLIAVFFVTAVALILHLSVTDFMIVVLLYGMVIGAELFNTAVEHICNILRDRYHLPYEGSRDIRDMAAGAVWIQAIVAIIIAGLLLSKYL